MRRKKAKHFLFPIFYQIFFVDFIILKLSVNMPKSVMLTLRYTNQLKFISSDNEEIPCNLSLTPYFFISYEFLLL